MDNIKVIRTGDTILKFITEKGTIILTFKDKEAVTFFVDLYTETAVELYPLICNFSNNELIIEEEGAEFKECVYLDRHYLDFAPKLEAIDK